MGWLLIIMGGIIEIFWVSGLKYSTSLPMYALTALGICVSFICAIKACKSLEVSVAYAVLVGIGTGGVAAAEMLFFDNQINIIRIILIFILLIGVVGLKLTSNKE